MRRADAFFRGDLVAQRSLAQGARQWLAHDPRELAFHTGSSRFDGEWFLILHMAAALGFAQTALEHPELREEHLPLAFTAADRMLLAQAREHDRVAWNEDPRESLGGPNGHLAYLAYANLGLSLVTATEGASRFRDVNATFTDSLAHRYAASRSGILDSYPGEAYPADNAVALASILLYDHATGSNHGSAAQVGLEALAHRCTDPASGLFFQRVDSATGAPRDAPRASGTAMAAFALGYAAPRVAEQLWAALTRQADGWLGFGGIREYPTGVQGSADIDSGPVIFGLSVSASGFGLASARRMKDRPRFRSLFASTWLFGLPATSTSHTHFVAGGALGDVILFALMTARSPT